MTCSACGYDSAAIGTCPRCGSALATPSVDPAWPTAEPGVSPWAPPGYFLPEPSVVSSGHEPTIPVSGFQPAVPLTGHEPSVPLAGSEPTTRLPWDGAPAGEAGSQPAGAWGPPDPSAVAGDGGDWTPQSGGFRSPQEYATAMPAASFTVAAPQVEVQPAGARKRRVLPVLLVAIAVLIAGAGVATAGAFLGWFGSRGSGSAAALPASTVAYLQLDTNPTLAQKLQAWEFLRDLPEVRDAVASGQPDPKRMLWDLLNRDERIAPDASYDVDVKPWLGDRVGFGVLSRGGEAVWVTAVQVTDEAKGAGKLREWIDESRQSYDVTSRNGFAIVTMTKDTGWVFAELDKGTLETNQRFTADMATLGDAGVLAGWADLAGLATITNGTGSGPTTDLKGRGVFALRFSADTMRFDGKFRGLNPTAVPEAGELGELPMSTGAAMSVSGAAASLDLTWPWLGTEADSWVRQYGLEQADVAALLGRNISISIPTSALLNSGETGPAFGLRVLADDADRARTALHKLIVAAGGTMDVESRVDGDVLTAATTSEYLADLASPSARLSASGNFTKAVPDHARAVAAFYVNLEPMVSGWTSPGSLYETFVTSMRAAGGQYIDEGEGNGSWSIRLVRS